jgi:guanylate kinase
MRNKQRKPIIFLFSAPSGTGKTTVISSLLQEVDALSRIVTVTSRPKREGETEGLSHYFITEEEFRRLIRDDAFVEWNQIYGDFYGTKKELVRRFIAEATAKHHDLLLEIDVDGKRNFSQQYPNCVSIFLLPPSVEDLERRMRGRKADTPEQMAKRIARAEMELARKGEYDYRVVNDSMEAALEEIKSIIAKERARRV